MNGLRRSGRNGADCGRVKCPERGRRVAGVQIDDVIRLVATLNPVMNVVVAREGSIGAQVRPGRLLPSIRIRIHPFWRQVRIGVGSQTSPGRAGSSL
jgi:hypothetical protein